MTKAIEHGTDGTEVRQTGDDLAELAELESIVDRLEKEQRALQERLRRLRLRRASET